MKMEAGKLLTAPMASTDRSEVRFQRVAPDYKDKSEPFVLQSGHRDYQRQYFYVYGQRLEAMRSRVEASALEKFGSDVPVKRLSQLNPEEDTDNIVVVGTLYKSQALKPNILRELGEEAEVLPDTEKPTKYIEEGDELILEDELQRARLHLSRVAVEEKGLSVDQFVTGVVCGVYGKEIPAGKEEGSGKFRVDDIIFARQPSWPVTSKKEAVEEDRYVAFISGLELSGREHLGDFELVTSWLTGAAGEMSDQEANSRVERLIIAGNSLSSSTKDRDVLSTAKYLTSGHEAKSVDAVADLDHVLKQLASSIDVDLMPGENDPANQNLPQQPLHRCLFPLASPYPTLKTVTNPYMFEASGHLLLGTSGQNVNDIMRNCSLTNSLDALERTLEWSHLAPTCPDTLGCFPYMQQDPFVLSTRPHILFAANQDKFDHRLIQSKDGEQKTLLLSIPRFVTTKQIVLLNMKNLQCHAVTFDYNFDAIDTNSPEPNK